jgi:tripartite-type tricarboxylate transporter receptor subunit TctC
MEKLLAYAKSHPGKLTYGTAGYGSSQHLLGEYFKQHGWPLRMSRSNGSRNGTIFQAIIKAGDIKLE